ADDVLRTLVAPLVRGITASGAADSWFFIRYGDPDWHVRLRFGGKPERLMSEVLPALHAAAAPLIADGRIWKMQLVAYEREIDRYGSLRGVELAEKLFHADSMAVMQIVELLSGDEGADARWRLAVRGMDMLLSDLGFELEAKLRVLKQARESFGKEFRVEDGFERQLGDKYRGERLKLEELLDPAHDASSPLQPGFELLKARSAAQAATVAELIALERQGGLTAPLPALAGATCTCTPTACCARRRARR